LVGMFIYWEDFRNIVIAVGVAIFEMFKGLIDGAGNAVNAVGKFFSDMAEGIAGAFEAILDPIEDAINTIVGWVKNALKLARELVEAIFGGGEEAGGGDGSAPAP